MQPTQDLLKHMQAVALMHSRYGDAIRERREVLGWRLRT